MPKRYIVELAFPFECPAEGFINTEVEAESPSEARRLAEASHPDHIGYAVTAA